MRLPIDEPDTGKDRDAEFADTDQQRFAVTEAVDRGNAAAEREGTQRCALPVEGVAGARRMRQEAQAERQCGKTDREIDGKQIGPGRDRKNCRGHAGADGGGDRNHHGIEPDAAAELRARIDEAYQRGVDAHDAGRAKSLHDARHRQHQQSVRERAGERSDGEQHESGEVDTAIADDLAKRGER